MNWSRRSLTLLLGGLGLLALLLVPRRDFGLPGSRRESPVRAAAAPPDRAGIEADPAWPPRTPPPLPPRKPKGANPLDGMSPGITLDPRAPEGTYVMRGTSASVYFNQEGVTLALLGASTPSAGPGERRFHALRWKPVDGIPAPPRPADELPGKVNSFVGSSERWTENAPTYKSVAYDQIAPGVDLRVESRPQAVKYTLEARRARDVEGMKFRYEGAADVRLVEDGRALEIQTEAGIVREDGLACWQEVDGVRRPVEARYAAVEGNTYEISLSGTDPEAPLTIDPYIRWSSYLGGTQNGVGDDYGTAVAVDAAGYVFLAGYTYSTDYPALLGFSSTLQGQIDAVLTKLTPAGFVEWSTYFGGTNVDYGYAVATDAAGDVVLVGNTSSADFPVTAGSLDTVFNGSEAFVAKFTSAGARSWATYFGGTSSDYGTAVAVDAGGIYIGGYTYSAGGFPVTAAFDATHGGGGLLDGFVAKLNLAGTAVIYSTYVGGSMTDYVLGLAVNSAGECFATGYTYSADFNQGPGIDNSIGGTPDAFLLKIKAAGGLEWSTFLGGAGTENGNAVAVTADAAQDPVVVGYTTSIDYPTTAGAYDLVQNSTDAFVTRVRSDGTALVYSTYLGGTSTDYAYAVAPAGVLGGVYVSGYTNSSTFPTTALAFRTTLFGGYDQYVTHVNPTGTALTASTFVGGSSSDYGLAVAVLTSGAQAGVFVAGRTFSSDYGSTAASRPDASLGGSTDACVSKLALNLQASPWATYVGGRFALAENLAYDIAVDSAGNVVVGGQTNAVNYPTTAGAFDVLLNGSYDGFLAKIGTDAGGLPFFVWSTYMGGSSTDYISAVAVDNTDFILITGYTSSSDFPISAPTDDATLGSSDAFLTYLSPGGGIFRSTFIGGSLGAEYGRGVAVDNLLNVYVTGMTYASDFPVTAGAYDSTLSAGTSDAFVIKFNSSCQKQWATYYGGSSYEELKGIASDTAGNVYVTGYTQSTDLVLPAVGPDPSFNGGTYDAFLVKFNSAGAYQWARYIGGASSDQAHGVAVDGAGTAVVVVGQTSSANFPVLNAMDSTLASTDAFLIRVDPSTGDTVWATYLGGSSTDIANAVDVDPAGNAYVVGYTFSTNFPMKGAFDATSNGLYDVFVAKVYANGQSLGWSSYLGGTNYDYGYGIARVNAGAGAGVVFLSGYTQSSDFPLINALDPTMSSIYESFVVRLDNAPPAVPDFATAGTGQFRTGNGAAISTGGWTNENSFTVKAKLDDSDDEPLRLEVQLKPLGSPFIDADPGATTTETAPGAAAGLIHTLEVPLPGPAPAQYHWRARTLDGAGNASAWVVFGGTADINTRDIGYDTVGPAPLISLPTGAASFYTTASSIGVSGTVSDATSGTASVSWSNAGPPFASGGAAFTAPGPNWSVASIGLVAGANVVTISATDLAGNTGTAQITIYRDNLPPSTVSITSPATDPFITGVNGTTLTVNVVDNILVGSVEWVNDRGGFGPGSLASGSLQSGDWSVPVSGLSPGLNVITVTATDAAGNSAADAITLNYDVVSPSLAIGSPASGLVTAAASVALSGTASDNGQLVSLTWNNLTTGDSGAVSPPLSPNWSLAAVPLSAGSGANAIQVTALDSVGLSSTQSITVYRDVDIPTIPSVTSPPTTPFVTGSATISIQGTAADNIGVGSVTVTNTTTGQAVTASLGTPGGTSTTWISPALNLQLGANTIQIVARDLVLPTPNASAITTITVTYDTNGPAVLVGFPAVSPYVTNAGTINLSGSASDNGTVQTMTCSNSAGGPPVAFPVVPNPSFGVASLTWTSNVTLQPGTNTITIQATDNTPLSTTVVVTVIYDPSAPTVKITGPTTADDFFTGSPTIALGGTASDNRAVTLVSWTNSANGANGNAVGTNSWTIASIPLVNGVQTLTVTSKDEAGNTAVDTLLVTLDPTAPTLVINVPTVSDTFTTDATDVALAGSASDAVGVTLITWNNAANGTSGAASGTTSWSVPTISLAAGSNPITVMAFDAASNLISDTLIVYRDTADPTGAVTFPSSSPFVTNSGTLLLAGSAADDIGVADVKWRNNNGPLQTAVGTGSWTASVTLVPGNNVLDVIVTDGFGNTNAAAPISVTVHYDPTAPVVTVTDPDAVPNAATNTSASPVTLGGSVSDLNGAGAAAAAQVAWTNLSTGGFGACAVGAGTWSASIPLTAGANTLQVTATDAAGNTASALFTATYDTAAPAVAITTPTADLTYSTATSPLLVAGTASDDVGLAGVAWTTTGSVTTTSGAATGTAAWNFSLELSAGANLVTVTATDVVGRSSTARVTITYDPTPPTVAVTSPTSEALFQSTVSPFSLGGQASDNIDIQGVTWTNTTTGESGTASGTTVWSIGAITLADGLNEITITATDGVGNIGAAGIVVDYDGLPPVITVTPPVPPDVAAGGPPYVTSTRPFPVAGTASDNQILQSVTWVNSRGGGGTATLGAGTWTAQVYLYPSPPDNVITFTATDAHGQTATASLTLTYNPESSAPSIDIQTPVVTDSATQVVAIGGVSSDNVGVVSVIWRNLTTGVQGPADPVAPGNYSTWSANVPLTSGANVIRATGFDDVGNSAVDTITITFAAPADAVPPGIDITGPTLASVWDENTSPMLLTASATDVGGSGVASVSWTNAGTGGDGAGTPGLGTVWTADIALAFGTNVITVTARDAAGNAATDTLIVNFIPAPGDAANPTVSIVPAPTGTVSVSAAPYALAGTASDNVAVATVVWSNAANGASGSAEGTATWALGLSLEPGINVITVKAYDTSALVDTDSITVLYTPPPPPPEVVPAGSCGLLGLDALALLALLAAWRRRRTG